MLNDGTNSTTNIALKSFNSGTFNQSRMDYSIVGTSQVNEEVSENPTVNVLKSLSTKVNGRNKIVLKQSQVIKAS